MPSENQIDRRTFMKVSGGVLAVGLTPAPKVEATADSATPYPAKWYPFAGHPDSDTCWSLSVGPDGRIVIQEWRFEPPVLTDLGECVPGESVLDAVYVSSRKTIVGVSTHHLFVLNVEPIQATVVAEVPAHGFLAMSDDSVFGQDKDAQLWRFDLASRKIHRAAVQLPEGDWAAPHRWARDSHTGLLFTADANGRLFCFDGNKELRFLGKTHLTPVGPMAVTADRRLYGFCGDEMANLFCCDTLSGTVSNFGVAASVLEHRRYGYQFGAAVTGRDGEIVFGEDDNSGHLWLYFPKVLARQSQ